MDESAPIADERRPVDTTVADGDDMANAAARGGGLGAIILAPLARLLAGSAAGGGSGRVRLVGRRGPPAGYHRG